MLAARLFARHVPATLIKLCGGKMKFGNGSIGHDATDLLLLRHETHVLTTSGDADEPNLLSRNPDSPVASVQLRQWFATEWHHRQRWRNGGWYVLRHADLHKALEVATLTLASPTDKQKKQKVASVIFAKLVQLCSSYFPSNLQNWFNSATPHPSNSQIRTHLQLTTGKTKT